MVDITNFHFIPSAGAAVEFTISWTNSITFSSSSEVNSGTNGLLDEGVDYLSYARKLVMA